MLLLNNTDFIQISTDISRLLCGSSMGSSVIPNLRVLVVDDDVLCLKIVTKMLKQCGYSGKSRLLVYNRTYIIKRNLKLFRIGDCVESHSRFVSPCEHGIDGT